jgi:hypothetical protein
VAERRQKSAGEELYMLSLIKTTRARQEGLKAIGVLLRGPCTPALSELEQRIRAEGRPKPQVQELLELPPRRRALVLLELDVPELRDALQIVRGHPHALLRHGALLAKIGFTLVDEEHRIGLAVVAGKIQFLEF